VLPYNDLAAVTEILEQWGFDIAAIIVEPIAGNMGCVPPAEGFLEGLRVLCDRFGSLLIFAEVMTGFRVAAGGAQALYGVRPDITTLGKIIGGGLPVGALGGSRAILDQLAPNGPVYQAGTLAGNPLAMAAGLKTLELLQQPGFHARLATNTETLCSGLKAQAAQKGIALEVNAVPGMFGIFFSDRPVRNFQDVMAADTERYARFFHALLGQGVYLAPSAFEAGFLSAAHDETVIARTLEATEKAFATL